MLVLVCEDEILKITETSHDDKEVTHDLHDLQYSHDFIDNYILVISCNYYYTKHWSKQKHLLPYHDTSNKLKEINIKNIFKNK